MSWTLAISATSRRELSSSFPFFLQNKAPKEIHVILTQILASFLPGRAKDLSAPLYYITHFDIIKTRAVIKFIFLQNKAPKEIHVILTQMLASFLPGRTKDLSESLYIKDKPSIYILPTISLLLPFPSGTAPSNSLYINR